jgi:hypothetical protein
MRQTRQANKIFIGNHEAKNYLGDLYIPGGVNIKVDVKYRPTCHESVCWIHVALDRDQRENIFNTVMNNQVP